MNSPSRRQHVRGNGKPVTSPHQNRKMSVLDYGYREMAGPFVSGPLPGKEMA
jgi:hypothetical protein